MQLNFKEWFAAELENDIKQEGFSVSTMIQKGKEFLTNLVGATSVSAADEIDKRQGKSPQETPTAPGVKPKSVVDSAKNIASELLKRITGPLSSMITTSTQNAVTAAKGNTGTPAPGGK